MHKNLRISAVLFLLTVLVVGASPAQAGLLEFFFPSLRQVEEDPSETLQAPFAYGDESPSKPAYLEEGSAPSDIDLAQPHRAVEEIAAWLTSVVSEAMTFQNPDLNAEFGATDPYFDVHGRRYYREFLQEKGIERVIQSNQYDVRSVVETRPVLLNEGAVDGRYRWLFEIPIMVTYVKRGTKDYKTESPVSQSMTLMVQVGRSDEAVDETGVLVERWLPRTPSTSAGR